MTNTVSIKLTAPVVRDLPFSEVGQRLVWDAGQPGFGVRVGATSKAYFVEGRVKITLADARKLAAKAFAEMADGKDRNAELRRERAKLRTLGEAMEGWIAERKLRKSTEVGYRNAMKREFGDWLGMEMRRITPATYQKRFQEIVERSPAVAAHATRTFQSLWNWARADLTDKDGNPMLPESPSAIVQRKKIMPKAKRKKSYVSDWKAFFAALDGFETNSNRHADAGVKFRVFMELLARTGLRMSEAAHLKWSDVDLKAKTFTIIEDRAKNGEALTLPMSKQTSKLFEVLRDHFGGKEFIWGDTHYGDPRKSLDAFRKALGFDVQFHDLRRSFATVATAMDIQQSKVKRLLNHASGNDVTAGYQILFDPELLRKSTQRVSDYIDAKGRA
jgi:integrase